MKDKKLLRRGLHFSDKSGKSQKMLIRVMAIANRRSREKLYTSTARIGILGILICQPFSFVPDSPNGRNINRNVCFIVYVTLYRKSSVNLVILDEG